MARRYSVDTDASFVYNENGLRVQKTANGVVTKYTLHGKDIKHMSRGSDELHFFYDAQNKPAVVVYNGTPYSYVKNLQGDIVAILNSAGTAVVNYVYDAWGRPISKTGSMADTLGSVQPFRYRGYVYDEETDLFYLRSRYYNIKHCRFINADILYKGNLFSYCQNTPVIGVDKDGFAVVCCFDDNGFESTLMSHFMYGGSCGGGNVGGVIGASIAANRKDQIGKELEAIGNVTLKGFNLVLGSLAIVVHGLSIKADMNVAIVYQDQTLKLTFSNDFRLAGRSSFNRIVFAGSDPDLTLLQYHKILLRVGVSAGIQLTHPNTFDGCCCRTIVPEIGCPLTEIEHLMFEPDCNMGCNIGPDYLNCDFSISYDMNEVIDQLIRFWVNGEDVLTMIN